jgi:hypothetical protein
MRECAACELYFFGNSCFKRFGCPGGSRRTSVDLFQITTKRLWAVGVCTTVGCPPPEKKINTPQRFVFATTGSPCQRDCGVWIGWFVLFCRFYFFIFLLFLLRLRDRNDSTRHPKKKREANKFT